MFVEYTFFPVGQGLFSCGKLYTDKNKKPFVWIYDCGTSKGGEDKLTAAIDELKDINEFDLVVISHFDADHISGLKILLAEKRVKRLMIPFFTDLQKVFELLGYLNNIYEQKYNITDHLTNDSLLFLKSPEDFIRKYNKSEKKIELLLVPGGYAREEIPPDISQKKDILPDDDFTVSFSCSNVTSVDNIIRKVLHPKSPIIVDNKWEFLPYNDVEEEAKFLTQIANIAPTEIIAILTGIKDSMENIVSSENGEEEKGVALNSLVEKHTSVISPISKNNSSLFLYSGRNSLPVQAKSRLGNDLNRHGILYTGDGNLKKIKKLNYLINFIGEKRKNNIYCLQVMHHGSRNNSCPDVAKELRPHISVFSADPQHKNRHPDGGVVFDFMNNGPALTDKKLQYAFCFSRCNRFPYKKWCPWG